MERWRGGGGGEGGGGGGGGWGVIPHNFIYFQYVMYSGFINILGLYFSICV